MSDNKTREREFHDARFKEDVDPRDKLGKYYAITGASNDLFKQLIVENIRPGQNLLEYGCGTEGDFSFYKKLGCNLFGIDISKEAIAKQSKKASSLGINASYSVQDAESTTFAPQTFDLVVGSGILHHLSLQKSLAELARITTPEGACVFSEPLGHNPVINLFRNLTPKLRTVDEHPLLDADLQLMRRYFKEVSVHYFYLFSLMAVAFRKTSLFDKVYGKLMGLDNYLIRRFPSLGKYAWICIIKLKSPQTAALNPG